MEPYYNRRWALMAKKLIDFFYDPLAPDNYHKRMFFSRELLKGSLVTHYARITQGAKYLAAELDPQNYANKVANLRVSRKGKHQICISLRDSNVYEEEQAGEFLRKTVEGSMVGLHDKREDRTKEIVRDDETGEDTEIDISVGEAEWKHQLIEFMESSAKGDVLEFDGNVKFSPKLLKAVKYYIDTLSGEEDFTILALDNRLVKVLNGKVDGTADPRFKGVTLSMRDIYVEGKTILVNVI